MVVVIVSCFPVTMVNAFRCYGNVMEKMTVVMDQTKLNVKVYFVCRCYNLSLGAILADTAKFHDRLDIPPFLVHC